MSSFPMQALSQPGVFAADRRFAVLFGEVPAEPETEQPDPAAEAYERGLHEGAAAATAEAERKEMDREAARGSIELAFARLDDQLRDELSRRLRQTVLALCEATVAPLAIDMDGLAARVERAVSMLSRAQDNRVVLLNPDDLESVRLNLPDGVSVRADPGIERGGLRIETPDGGVEDGPANWRRILLEAFREC